MKEDFMKLKMNEEQLEACEKFWEDLHVDLHEQVFEYMITESKELRKQEEEIKARKDELTRLMTLYRSEYTEVDETLKVANMSVSLVPYTTETYDFDNMPPEMLNEIKRLAAIGASDKVTKTKVTAKNVGATVKKINKKEKEKVQEYLKKDGLYSVSGKEYQVVLKEVK